MKDFRIDYFLDFLSKNKISHEFEIIQNELSVIISLSKSENIQIEFFDIYFEIWFPKFYYSTTYENIDFETICRLVETVYFKRDVIYEEEYYKNKIIRRDIFISHFLKIENYRISFYSILKKILPNTTYKKFNLDELLMRSSE